MRTFAQDAAFYRKVRVDGPDDPEALRRLKELEAIDAIRQRFTLAEALGVGRSTCYERKRRLREEGARGLVPRSSRPKSHPLAAVDDGGRQGGAGAVPLQRRPKAGPEAPEAAILAPALHQGQRPDWRYIEQYIGGLRYSANLREQG